MTTTIDLTFEFDPSTDPAEATDAVLALLAAVPGAMDVDAEPSRPLAADIEQTVVTVLAVFTVLKLTVLELDDLTTKLRVLVRNLKGFRGGSLRSDDEERKIDDRPGAEAADSK